MCTNRRNPIRCIIPPYIADKMLKSKKFNTDEALDNKFRNHRFRSDREFFANLTAPNQKLMAIKKIGATKPKAVIEIYNCAHGTKLPGKKMVAASIAKSKDATNVLNGSLTTWNFYYSIFKRNSIDNAGMAMIQSVHYSRKYNNAMWNGRQMVYGDGDKITFDSFTVDLDIIGHELAHGVTQYAANFDYELQSGALNESFSDVFGIMIKQFALNETAKQSNWLIGENVMLGKKYALRNMKAPGTAYKNHPEWGNDPQPATMDKFVKLANTEDGDWGGVHYNSGIPNYAFTMAALELGGKSWETVGKVWYAALTKTLKHNSNFKDAKAATILHAGKLFGKGSAVELAVMNGWKKAKV